MGKIEIKTACKKLLADIYTPVGIYLRVRDRFRDTILLESTDHHAAENSWSFICINAIAGIEIGSFEKMELKYPGQPPEKIRIDRSTDIPQKLWDFSQRFDVKEGDERESKFGQGLFGYAIYDAVRIFDSVKMQQLKDEQLAIPLIRYRFYQYVIAIDHFRDELYLCENIIRGIDSELQVVESLIRGKDVPVYPFRKKAEESSNMRDEDYISMVKKGIQSCKRGDVFQIVLSRRFQQQFTGDEFNVYRTLRSVNPSPYLFYFDYGDYKLFGSSPEAQLVISNNKAIIHPIAGTVKRTGDDETDKRSVELLKKDPKENAEHVMLVDLARNDLSRECNDVNVTQYKQVQYFSHVIHLVSEVAGKLRENNNPFRLLAKTFPAGTLSGAPKIRAMELISDFESSPRSYYGGMIGFIGFDGSCNHAIMIRSFMSKNNELTYQAGAGIVSASKPENELQEVNNKLAALKKAIELAERLE
jgi:anthranilate synthase component I